MARGPRDPRSMRLGKSCAIKRNNHAACAENVMKSTGISLGKARARKNRFENAKSFGVTLTGRIAALVYSAF
jgi:hypothetical protein